MNSREGSQSGSLNNEGSNLEEESWSESEDLDKPVIVPIHVGSQLRR